MVFFAAILQYYNDRLCRLIEFFTYSGLNISFKKVGCFRVFWNEESKVFVIFGEDLEVDLS